MTSASVGASARPSLVGLMQRYVGGDGDAFRALYRCIAPRVRRQLRARVGDPQELDDLVQLVFLLAHGARTRFEPRSHDPDEALVAWFCAIARNTAASFVRGSYRLQLCDEAERRLGELCDDHDDAETAMVRRATLAERHRRVHAALERLPARQREVVRLHKLEGLPMAEVARRLGVRDVAVRVRAHRAYASLKDWMDPRGLASAA